MIYLLLGGPVRLRAIIPVSAVHAVMPLPCLCGLVFMRYVRLGPNTRGLLGPPAPEPAETKTASKCDETYPEHG